MSEVETDGIPGPDASARTFPSPSASERSAPIPPPHVVRYRINLSKVTFAEIRASVPWRTQILLVILLKILRLRLPASSDDAAVSTLRPFRVPDITFAPATREVIDSMIRDLELCGFDGQIHYNIDDFFHSTGNSLITLAHRSLPVVARIHLRVWAISQPPKVSLFTEFLTEYPDGAYLWSLSSKADFQTPPNCTVVRRIGAKPTELFRAHQEELARQARTHTATPVRSPEEAAELTERHHECVRDYFLSRGVFTPLTQQEESQADGVRASRGTAAQGGSAFPDILAEIHHLQNARSSLSNSLVMFFITLVLFLIIGIQGYNSFLRLLALVPILLFHEFGHYVAMRLCGFRNLRMFFIPGFGAAVTGRAYNVPGWKRIIVSLMGPLPGIFVGIVVGLCGMVFDRSLAVDAALMILLLNGFNLLPILPLDGGHVMRSLLYARHPLLDLVFQAVAILALAAAAIFLHLNVFYFAAAFMAFGLVASYRMANVVRELRQEGINTVSPDDQSIPAPVAERIITKLRAASPKPLQNRVVAQQTLAVYSSLNERPPGWLSGLSLAGVYVVSFAASIIFSMVFALSGRPGGFGGFVREARDRPAYALTLSDIQRTGVHTAPSTPDVNTVVAIYANASRAQHAYEDISSRLAPGESAMLLANAALIRLGSSPEDRRNFWIDDLQSGATEVFIDGAAMRAMFRIDADAPDEATAKRIVDEVNAYTSLPLREAKLLAPWSLSQSVAPAARFIRTTYVRLESINPYEHPDMVEFDKQRDAARRRGDQAQVKSLNAEYQARYKAVRLKLLEELVAAEADSLDVAFAREYIEASKAEDPEKVFRTLNKDWLDRFGVDSATPSPSGRSGYISHSGPRVKLALLSFHDPSEGFVALAKWLEAQGCKSLRYDIEPDDLEQWD